MTDRELLDLAAKAAGIECDEKGPFTSVSRYDLYNGMHTVDLPWNPLTDDGDALRLAMKLRILVQTDICFSEVPYEKQCQATRRAIVRAAAEIGKK